MASTRGRQPLIEFRVLGPLQVVKDERLLALGGLRAPCTPATSNFFYTVTVPVTLWFLDRGKLLDERRVRRHGAAR